MNQKNDARMDSKKNTRVKSASRVNGRQNVELSLDSDALYDQCITENDFQSQYEEECPVNYSLKYSETELFKNSKSDDETNFHDWPKSVYSCENQTPLMFSRCSSLSSLSSFEHITQSIPDDRSSVVSEFSRTTSGIISPSELPDSPTQTAPSSPKRNKSVFEDDVTTYKQEDTPIEKLQEILSNSISNIHLEEKSENSMGNQASSKRKSSRLLPVTSARDDRISPKSKFAVDSNIHAIFSNPSYECSDDDVHTYHTEGTPANISHAGSHSDLSILSMTSGIRPGTEEESDKESFHSGNGDVLVTHCNESGITKEKTIENKPKNPIDEAADQKISNVPATVRSVPNDDSYFVNQTRFDYAKTKDSPHLVKHEISPLPEKTGEDTDCKINKNKSHGFSSEHLMDDGKPCGLRGQPLSTLPELDCSRTVSNASNGSLGVDNWGSQSCTPLEEALVEQCIRLGMPQRNRKVQVNNSGSKLISRSKIVKDRRHGFSSEHLYDEGKHSGRKGQHLGGLPASYESNPMQRHNKNFQDELDCSRTVSNVSNGSLGVDNWGSQSCTPLEEALVEQCIRLGMPQRKMKVQGDSSSSKLIINKSKIVKDRRHGFSSEHLYDEGKHFGLKGQHLGGLPASYESNPMQRHNKNFQDELDCSRTVSNVCNGSLGVDNWGSQSCTPLEEALVEQCIRLGMPQRKMKVQGDISSSKLIYKKKFSKERDQRCLISQKYEM